MMKRPNQKTVKSVEAKKGEIKSKFGIFGRVIDKIRGTKTVLVEVDSDVRKLNRRKLTDYEINKIFKLHDKVDRFGIKKYSIKEIARLIGVTESCIKYWLDPKQKIKREQVKQVTPEEIKELTKFNERFDEKGRLIPRKQRGSKTPTAETPAIVIQTQDQATLALAEVMVKDKYYVENQANPDVFKTNPPQATATREAWKDQRNRNNINRVNTAKILQSKQEAQNLPQEGFDKAFAKHSKKEPIDHYGYPHKPNRCCCGVNEPDWVKIHPVLSYDQWKTGNRSQNWEKKQYADRMKLEQEARDKGQKTEYFCLQCNAKLSDQQARNSSQIFGKMYCSSHEPIKEKGGFIL